MLVFLVGYKWFLPFKYFYFNIYEAAIGEEVAEESFVG